MQSTCEMLGWMKHKLESGFPGEISITSDNTPTYGRKRRRTKEPLEKVKEESEKVGLKLNIQKTKIMAPGPIISWEIDGQTVEQCQTSFFGAPKSLQVVTAAMKLKEACSLESYDQPR